MTFLRGLRELVLGETWTLPLGVLSLLGSAAALRAAAPELWDGLGAIHLTVGPVLVLSVSLAVSGRTRGRRPSGDP